MRQYVGDNYVGDPRSQLDTLLEAAPSDISDDDSSPYHFLDHLYLHVVHNALPPPKRKRLLARYQVVVGTIVTVVEPLPMESLARLLDLRVENIKSALTFLPSVISVPSSDSDKPQVYHPSFPDFITDSNRCKDPELVIVSSDHHRRLAVQCLLYLIKYLKRDICDIGDQSRLNSEIEDLDEKVVQATSPLYAVTLATSHRLHTLQTAG